MKKKPKCLGDPGIVMLAEGLRALSDPNRLRMMCLLLRGERCVCEVERELGISQQLASHHLNVLKDAGFLEMRREGTSSYYSVVRERLDGLLEVMQRYLGCCRSLIEEGQGTCRPAEEKQGEGVSDGGDGFPRNMHLAGTRGRTGK